MRLTIDWRLCVGSGACVASSPAAFALVPSGDGFRAVLVAPPASDDAALEAAAACPTLAIALTAADGRAIYPVARA